MHVAFWIYKVDIKKKNPHNLTSKEAQPHQKFVVKSSHTQSDMWLFHSRVCCTGGVVKPVPLKPQTALTKTAQSSSLIKAVSIYFLYKNEF